MKNKLILYALHFFFLFNICAYAQDITPGYYRVTNVGLSSYGGTIKGKTVKEECYAYVANGSYIMAKGSGAKQNIQSMQMFTGIDNAVVSPQTVVYITKQGNNYDLEAQGKTLSQIAGGYDIKVELVYGTTDTYTLTTTVSGIAASLWVDKTKTGMYNMEGDMAYPTNYQATTTSQGEDAYRQWKIVPISTTSNNYAAVNACLKVKDEEDETKYKYYAPYYASYPFKLASPGMKAYYVSSINDKKYTLQEITSEVIPGATPVIIECPSNNPTDCKIEPLRGDYGSISGNKLKGVYFCNLSMSPTTYSDCRTEFKSESMRVWAVKDGKLILTNNPDKTRAVPLALSGYSGIWLRPNESYLADVPSTAAAELISAGKATTISFDTDGGTEVEYISGGEGEPVTAPANPTKTGYTFNGWEPALPSVFPAEDMTVKAKWQINQYTITFDTDGGTAIAPITQDYNTAIMNPSDPTKEGCSFAGWDKDIPALMPAENMTIKALWSVGKYTITFDTDGGTAIAPISQDYGTTITAPTNPTKTGYTFVGWDKVVPSTMPAENVVIKAQWKINQYTITFDTDGGTTITPITQDYNTTITKPSDPTKDGSVFAGWDKEIPSNMPAENMTIKALWKKLYTITFNTDGGTEVASITKAVGEALTAPANPTKTGYTFASWNPAFPETMPENDLELKALWNKNQHKVTFYNHGDIIFKEVFVGYDEYIVAPTENPEWPGHTFLGWSLQPQTKMPDEDVSYKAIWDEAEFTITFVTDGGTVISPITQKYDTDVTAPADPTKTGYTFEGWDKEIPSKMPASNLTITAKWKINEYTLSYYVDNEVYKSAKVTFDSEIVPEPAPVKEGYTFSGWKETIPVRMPANDVTITGNFSISKYTITFDTDGGTAVDPITQDYNTAIVKPSDPTRTGYTFLGWDKDIPSTMPAEDMTIKAQWKINEYTITFDTDGGTEVAPITQNYNTSIAKPNNPMKEGYTFAGWDKEIPSTMPAENMTIKAQWQVNEYILSYYTYTDDVPTLYKSEKVAYNSEVTAEPPAEKVGYTFSGWKEEIPSVMPAKDVTITGTFTINKHTITFDSNGGTEVASITQNYGTNIQVDAPTKDGYDFAGWYPTLPETMPDEDLALKAIWGPKTVEETYPLGEGWTWISFYMINPDMSSFDTVLSSLKWTSTDEIKGADTWAIYSEKKKKWVGTMEGFNDLSMYKIHSSYSDQELKLNGGYINSKADQKVSVEKGWNYLPYLSLSVLPVDEALQNYAASEGDILKSQTQSATFINGVWNVAGGLTAMEPGKGYMLYRSADNKVDFIYPIALEENSNNSRVMRFENDAQRFSSNMNVFATVEGVMAVPGDSIVAVAVDGVRGGTTIDNEGKASLTILGDNNADIYLTLMHNNTIVASAKAPISYASDNIVGSYANPTAIEFVEGSEAWSGDYNVTAIFTMDGKKLPSTDIKTLTTGLYIIKYETLSDNNNNTGGCRVIRVVR